MHSMHCMQNMGGGPAAPSYICLKDRSKRCKPWICILCILCKICGGRACCAVVFMLKNLTKRCKGIPCIYAFSKYAGGGAAPSYLCLKNISKRCKGIACICILCKICGGGPLAPSYIWLKDRSKRCKLLNMHSMHSMQNMQGEERGCAVVFMF